jgi:cell fate (sporulation/competence/biofilm development) regulator YmcA (YheA/YmcA/DUF963 family)
MGDAAEGLVDAESRIQERLDELQSRKKVPVRVKDADRERALESCRLAKAELERQLEVTRHPVRRQQIEAAIAELDRRIAENQAVSA